MKKLISWNVNGIRAVERKGDLADFLQTHKPDVLFIQEIKAKSEQITHLDEVFPDYVKYYHPAEKPGYAGTGIWIKKQYSINHVQYSVGFPEKYQYTDNEGRISRLDITLGDTDFSLLGVYFPNGGKSPEAWDDKLVFYDTFLAYVNDLQTEGKEVIWCGDVNCAHEEIDIARPKENEKSIGFLPEERAWVSRCIQENWVDVFRSLHPEKVMYSWWHLISRARARNVGWRIDYFFVHQSFRDHVESIEYLNDQMGSDHCPVELTIK